MSQVPTSLFTLMQFCLKWLPTEPTVNDCTLLTGWLMLLLRAMWSFAMVCLESLYRSPANRTPDSAVRDPRKRQVSSGIGVIRACRQISLPKTCDLVFPLSFSPSSECPELGPTESVVELVHYTTCQTVTLSIPSILASSVSHRLYHQPT